MPAGKENARKRNAPAAPRPVLTIEVIEGPTKGQKFTKQVRSLTMRETRARAFDATPPPPSSVPRVSPASLAAVSWSSSGSSPLVETGARVV